MSNLAGSSAFEWCSPVVRKMLERHPESSLPLTASAAPVLSEEAAELQGTPLSVLFPGAREARAALSGLLLLAGDWEGCHRLSQAIAGVDGSYWHGIAHRMEPDSFNAGYWFRRVGRHPIFPELAKQAETLLMEAEERRWQCRNGWDPFRFIEWCEEARQEDGGRLMQLARAVQGAEWKLLFTWCAQPPSQG